MAEHAADTHALARAGLDVAVAARAQQNSGLAGLYHPHAVLLILLGRPLMLAAQNNWFFAVLLCHSSARNINERCRL